MQMEKKSTEDIEAGWRGRGGGGGNLKPPPPTVRRNKHQGTRQVHI